MVQDHVCTYLAKLILPPPTIESHLLVPFCGAGSEMAGALKAGWAIVTGVDNGHDSESGKSYVDIANVRIPALLETR